MSSVINLSISDLKVNGSDVYINPAKINKNPGMLLIFANWCGHCKHFLPTYNKLSIKLNKKGNTFPCLGIEDAELKKNSTLTSALNFQGYPTVKFFDQSGKIISDYNGDRSESDLLNTVCKVYHHCVLDH